MKPFIVGFPGLDYSKSSRLEAELGLLAMLAEEDVEGLRKRLEASEESFSQVGGRYLLLGMLAELSTSSPVLKT